MKSRLGLVLVLALALVALFFWKNGASPPKDPPPTTTRPTAREPVTPAAPSPPIGNQFLDQYGDPSTSPALDLEKVGRVVEGIQLLIKNLDTRLIATNGQLSAFLTGNNREGLVYLSPDHPIFGPDGTLRDRWDTPVVIHPIGTGLIELRSAGPDRKLYTDDDLVRDPDGGVRPGSEPPYPDSRVPRSGP